MKQTTALLIVILALMLGVSAEPSSNAEPFSVKGDKLGETAAEWLASDPTHKAWTCGDVSHIAEGKTVGCFTLGGTPEKDTYGGALFSSESVSLCGEGRQAHSVQD